MSFFGEGAPKDFTEAKRWFKKSSDKGHRRARYNLGCIFANGQGVPRDFTRANDFFGKAADQNHSISCFILGQHYHEGRGVPQNRERALDWYLKAGELGIAEGFLNFALVIEEELETGAAATTRLDQSAKTEKRRERARSWTEVVENLEKAGDLGLAQAFFHLGSLFDEGPPPFCEIPNGRKPFTNGHGKRPEAPGASKPGSISPSSAKKPETGPRNSKAWYTLSQRSTFRPSYGFRRSFWPAPTCLLPLPCRKGRSAESGAWSYASRPPCKTIRRLCIPLNPPIPNSNGIPCLRMIWTGS